MIASMWGNLTGKWGFWGNIWGKIGVSVEIEHVDEIAETLGLFSLKYAPLKTSTNYNL